MAYHQDLNAYIWLVPLFFFVFLPFVLAIGGFLLRLARRFFFTTEQIRKEKRQHPRFIPYEGTFAEITDGDTTCTGLVSNISRLGINLKHLPDIFSDKIDKLTVVIRGYGVDHNLLIKPKWVLITESGKQIGAKIDMAPPNWNQFLMQTERISQSEPI